MGYHVKQILKGYKMGLEIRDLKNKPIDNAGISDLWFNYDHSAYQDEHTRLYDLDAMLEAASSFIITLQAAGIHDAPEPLALVEDFFHRL